MVARSPVQLPDAEHEVAFVELQVKVTVSLIRTSLADDDKETVEGGATG